MIKIFKCEFCTYTNEHKIAVLNHEKGCIHNPLNSFCCTCKNLSTLNDEHNIEICTDGFDIENHAIFGKCNYHVIKENLKNKLTYATEIIKTNPSKKKEIKVGQLSLV